MKGNIFVTSDHHFGHSNMINLADRPFSNVEEMDNHMIDCWNSIVGKYDVVYYLGDFTMGNTKTFWKYAQRLNGYISFMRGNHDRWFKNEEFRGNGFFNKLPDIHILRHEGYRFVLCHYPLMEWEGYYKGYYHLYGHVHGNLKHPHKRAMEIGVDTNNFYPYPIEQVIDRFIER